MEAHVGRGWRDYIGLNGALGTPLGASSFWSDVTVGDVCRAARKKACQPPFVSVFFFLVWCWDSCSLVAAVKHHSKPTEPLYGDFEHTYTKFILFSQSDVLWINMENSLWQNCINIIINTSILPLCSTVFTLSSVCIAELIYHSTFNYRRQMLKIIEMWNIQR